MTTLAVGGVSTSAQADVGTRTLVAAQVAKMSLEDKVGQLFIQQVFGAEATAPDPRNDALYGTARSIDVVKQFRPGGIVFFPWTDSYSASPEALAVLSTTLNDASPTGLLIAADSENSSLPYPSATQLPSAMALAATGSIQDTQRAAQIGGTELRAVGINTNLAPVCDVDNPKHAAVGVRSFSSDPQLAATMVKAQVTGYQVKAGIAACAKHFPGHGTVEDGSRDELPVATHTLEQWKQIDAPPFVSAIDAGVDLIMVTHVKAPHLDPSGKPASLSREVITTTLRQRLGFDGVVITDALDTPALRRGRADPQIALEALEAGADMLLMCPEPRSVKQAIIDAVRGGQFSQWYLNRKVSRILSWKSRHGLVSDGAEFSSPNLEVIGSQEHREAAAQIADRSITVVRNDGTLPTDLSSKAILVTGWGERITEDVRRALSQAGAAASRINTGSAPTGQEIESVAQAATQVDLVVALTHNLTPESSQQKLVNRLRASGTKLVTVAVDTPYDVGHHNAPVALCTYCDSPAIAPALARIIAGDATPQGKLPVTVEVSESSQADYAVGHGLTY